MSMVLFCFNATHSFGVVMYFMFALHCIAMNCIALHCVVLCRVEQYCNCTAAAIDCGVGIGIAADSSDWAQKIQGFSTAKRSISRPLDGMVRMWAISSLLLGQL